MTTFIAEFCEEILLCFAFCVSTGRDSCLPVEGNLINRSVDLGTFLKIYQ